MSELLFTGQVPIPNIAAAADKTGQILQNYGVMQAKQRQLQSQQMKAAKTENSKLITQLYGKGLAGIHESVLPFAREAIDMTAQKLQGMLRDPNGAIEGARLVRNTFDSIERYKDSEEWHKKEEEVMALIDQSGPEYAAAVKGMNYYRPNVNADTVAEQMKIARGGGVQDMDLQYNPDGSWAVMGTDMDSEIPTDISTHSWINKPGVFGYGLLPVEHRSSQEIGVAAGNVHKGKFKDPTKVYADVLKDKIAEGTKTIDFSGIVPTNPAYEIRVNAFETDRADLMKDYGIQDEEDLFSLYQFGDDPRLEGDLGEAIRKSVVKEAERIATESMYTVDPDDDPKEVLAQRVYDDGAIGKETIQSTVIPGAEGTGDQRNIAVYNLQSQEGKIFDKETREFRNPLFDEFLRVLDLNDGDELPTMRALNIFNVPRETLDQKIDAVVLREDMPNIVTVTFDGDNEVVLDLTDEGPEATEFTTFMKGAFSKAGLTLEDFRKDAVMKWRGGTESVAPEGTTTITW